MHSTEGKYKHVEMVSATKKMRSKCGGHEISICQISSNSKRKIKMFDFSDRRLKDYKQVSEQENLTLALKFGKMPKIKRPSST